MPEIAKKPQILTIIHRAVDSLTPYARNARTHSAAQVAQLAASILEYGWTNPVLIDGAGMILAGHGRIQAARKLGMVEVPTIDISWMSEAQRRAYILADNKLALNAGWDEAMLALEMGELKAAGWDMDLTGFDQTEVNKFMSAAEIGGVDTLADEDTALDAPAPAAARLGDIWRLGNHLMLCGNAGDALSIQKLMGGEKAALCFTSPPYKSQRVYDSGPLVDWDSMMREVCAAAPLARAGQLFVNLGLAHNDGRLNIYWNDWLDWMAAHGWRNFGWYVWDQGPGLPGEWHGRLAPAHEFIFHFNMESRAANKIIPCKGAGEVRSKSSTSMRSPTGKAQKWSEKNKQTQDYKVPDSVVRIMRAKGAPAKGLDHPAIFPVALPEHFMLAYSSPGEICYEPFCGSGTSIIAGQKTGRIIRAVELGPSYVDVAIERFRRLFPEAPITLADSGEPLEKVIERRARQPEMAAQ